MKPALLPLLGLAPLVAAAENPRLEFARGVLAELRDDEAAAEHFEDALAADPAALPLVERVAAIRAAQGDRAGAAKLFRDLAAARGDDLDVQLRYVGFLESHGRGDAVAESLAKEALEAALLRHPDHPELLRRLFHVKLENGDRSGAVELLERFGSDPASVLTYASLWRAAYDRDEAEALVRLDERFEQAMTDHPTHARLARAASEHFRTTGRLEQAIGILESHTIAAPASLALRTRLGILKLAADREDEGAENLREVLAIDPRDALAHQALAKLHRMRDEPEPARLHAAELLKIRGGSTREFLELADEWLAADDPRNARLLLEKAIFDHPASAEIAAKLAVATRRDPETKNRAGRLFREAEAAFADSEPEPDFIVESAETLLEAGESAAAEERLRLAIRSFPPEAKRETAAAMRRLASIWEAEGRNAAAAKSLRQRADALDPHGGG